VPGAVPPLGKVSGGDPQACLLQEPVLVNLQDGESPEAPLASQVGDLMAGQAQGELPENPDLGLLA